MQLDWDRARDEGKRMLIRVVRCFNCGHRIWLGHVVMPLGDDDSGVGAYSWQEPPERISPCMSCPLDDCKDTSERCPLKQLPAKASYFAREQTPEYLVLKRSYGKSQLAKLIKARGYIVLEWCAANRIKYHQLIRYEFDPPEAPTPISSHITRKLAEEGINWNHECRKETHHEPDTR